MRQIEKCVNGHPRNKKNAGVRGNGKKFCKTCRNESTRRSRNKKAGRTGDANDWARICARQECGRPFLASPSRPSLQYCSKECRRLVTLQRKSARIQKSRLPIAPLIEYAEQHGILSLPRGIDGTVGLFEADEYAVKHLGTHPALIYGQAWWEAEAA
jgi:hypothetical protein